MDRAWKNFTSSPAATEDEQLAKFHERQDDEAFARDRAPILLLLEGRVHRGRKRGLTDAAILLAFAKDLQGEAWTAEEHTIQHFALTWGIAETAKAFGVAMKAAQ